MQAHKQLNSDEAYIEIGKQSAEARNQRDEARAQFHSSHFRRMKALEPDDLKEHVDKLYRESYEANRRIGYR